MKQFFPEISKIQYEGPGSKNPLAFKFYDPDEKVNGKSMKEHLRFSIAYWHSFRGTGSDPFGSDTMVRPWDDGSTTVNNAIRRVHAAFEFMEKLGAPFYCFHDRDVAPEGKNLTEAEANLDKVVAVLKEEQKRTGIRLLWGTANLFSHPRYGHGASTSCNADVFAFAAAQVKKALEITKELGGSNYVFWGGREGYETLLNTDMKRELDHLALFLQMAVDYARKIKFNGQFLIEPKPKEPTKHQYDFDAQTVIGFLKTYGLDKSFKLNIEANHATLAGHTFEHELETARINGMLGSIDANQGDLLLGWDTDQFPTDLYTTTKCMLIVLENDGLAPGGLNFDAKPRRTSFQPQDLFLAHIAGMDAFARGLKIAAAIRQDGRIADFIKQRYSSWSSGIGAKIEKQQIGFAELSKHAKQLGNLQLAQSGGQEMLEAIINQMMSSAG